MTCLGSVRRTRRSRVSRRNPSFSAAIIIVMAVRIMISFSRRELRTRICSHLWTRVARYGFHWTAYLLRYVLVARKVRLAFKCTGIASVRHENRTLRTHWHSCHGQSLHSEENNARRNMYARLRIELYRALNPIYKLFCSNKKKSKLITKSQKFHTITKTKLFSR